MDFANLSAGYLDRYRILNLQNLASGRQSTVEFRAFAGTLNPTKMVAYIRMCIGLAERALNSKRPVTWDAPAINVERALYRNRRTPGQVEMIRLLFALGWFRGDTPRAYGELLADELPSIKSGAQILLKMAAKYDGVENVPFTAEELS